MYFNHRRSIHFVEASSKKRTPNCFRAVCMFKIPESPEFYGRALIFLRSCRQLPFVENKRGAYKFAVKHSLSLSPPPALSRRFSKISWCRSRLPRVPATKTFRFVRYSQATAGPASFRALWCRQFGGPEKQRHGSLATVGVIPFFDNDHPRTASARYHTLPSAPPLGAPYLPTPQSLRADLGLV